MVDEVKWWYSKEQRDLLEQRFGPEVVPLLDTAASFIHDIKVTPPNTVRQCCKSGCAATQIRLLIDGVPQWHDVLLSNYAGTESACGEGKHDWKTLVRKSTY